MLFHEAIVHTLLHPNTTAVTRRKAAVADPVTAVVASVNEAEDSDPDQLCRESLNDTEVCLREGNSLVLNSECYTGAGLDSHP